MSYILIFQYSKKKFLNQIEIEKEKYLKNIKFKMNKTKNIKRYIEKN